jgi:RNA polymerase sigma-70 factor, ECF subfamily
VPQWYSTAPGVDEPSRRRNDGVVTGPPHRLRLADADLRRLYREARAEQWGVDVQQFAAVLDRCLARSGDAPGSARDAARAAAALHLQDLALACGCIAGDDRAWEHFVSQLRPVLYRAADALSPGGGAREIADALYADLFGLQQRDGERRSLLAYYHGRSALSTWLRAVLAQRLVDRARAAKRVESLPDETALPAAPAALPDAERRGQLVLLQTALVAAIAALVPADRLRLHSYYRHGLTLAQIGRLSGEHEATVSRHLTRIRRTIKDHVIGRLRADGLDDEEIAACVTTATADAGPLDLDVLLGADEGAQDPRAAAFQVRGRPPGRSEGSE